MKNNKKIVVLAGAAALGLVAATGVTSGFAWFAVSNTVTATGMSLSAKSDAIFLEIQGSEDEGFGATGTNDISASLKPAAHNTFSNLAAVSTAGNWYYKTAVSPDAAAAADGDQGTALTDLTFADYVATSTYEVKVHTGSDVAYDLYVSSVTFSKANAGLRLIVAGENGYKEFSASAANIAFNAADIISDQVTTTAQTITAYLYIDGNDTNVYTANKATLSGSVEFTLEAFQTDHTNA